MPAHLAARRWLLPLSPLSRTLTGPHGRPGSRRRPWPHRRQPRGSGAPLRGLSSAAGPGVPAPGSGQGPRRRSGAGAGRGRRRARCCGSARPGPPLPAPGPPRGRSRPPGAAMPLPVLLLRAAGAWARLRPPSVPGRRYRGSAGHPGSIPGASRALGALGAGQPQIALGRAQTRRSRGSRGCEWGWGESQGARGGSHRPGALRGDHGEVKGYPGFPEQRDGVRAGAAPGTSWGAPG